MVAIFNFQSMLAVLLLMICTCAYIRALTPSLLDKNKTGFLGIFWKFARIVHGSIYLSQATCKWKWCSQNISTVLIFLWFVLCFVCIPHTCKATFSDMVDIPKSRLGTSESSQRPTPVPPWKQKNSERAKQLWDLLRKSVKLSTVLVKKSDNKPTTVRHGVHHFRKINHDEPLLDVVYNPSTEEYVTVDGQFIRIFYKDGRRKDIVDLGGNVTKLDYCTQSGHYVALMPPDEIKLFNSDFELISVAKSPQKVNSFIYNASTNEVVSCGAGCLMTWCFRYGNRYLVPHRNIREGLTCRDSFDKLVLERTESNTQRCFAVCGTAVAVFNLFQAELVVYKKDLHVRNITSILFFNPLKYIVTGSRDGSIKLWDDNFGIRLVFVGHNGPVTSLNLYPQGPYIMSASQDASIRVWSLETCDEVDLINMDEPVHGLGTSPRSTSLFSYSKYAVDLWTITHVHQIFTSIGEPVYDMKITPHPQLVDRVISQSEDGMVRLISPIDGSVLTTVVPPPSDVAFREESSQLSMYSDTLNSVTPSMSAMTLSRNLLDAVYCLPLEAVFAAYQDGTVIRASTITNPAKVSEVWKYEGGEQVNCLCLYEYTVNVTELKKSWEHVKTGATPVESKAKIFTKTRPIQKKKIYGNKIILLAGRKDGSIASIDKVTGWVLFSIEAHGAKGVIGLLANVRSDQVVSAGRDNIVKIWRMFPNTNEPLALLMSFYCAHTPLHLDICGNRLAVAFQQHSTATYTVVMYDLESKERFDHSPDYDHTDDLTGLACCSRLKLFASASSDGTIKIWNNDNAIVRTIKINDEPKSIVFCNQRGDLLVGLGKSIHYIEHSNYLPRVFLFKMVCMQFPTQTKEEPLSWNEQVLKMLDAETLKKVKNAKSSYMSMDYDWDPLTEEEQEKIAEERRERLDAFALMSVRDKELEKIRDGTLKPKRANRKPSRRTESIAFNRYMRLFYDRPSRAKIEDEDDFDPDPPRAREPTPQEWIPETKIGFFPPINAAKPIKEILEDGVERKNHLVDSGPDYDSKNKYIINPGGFIPNSILVKLLWPQSEMKKLEEEIWKPPVLTQAQQEMLKQLDERAKEDLSDIRNEECCTPMVSQGVQPVFSESGGEEDYEDRVFYMGSESEEDKGGDYEDEASMEPSAGPRKLGSRKPGKRKVGIRDHKIEKKPSSLMDKMRQAMKTPPPPPKSPTPPPTPPPPEPPKIKVPTRPSKPIVRFVSKPPPPKEPTPPPPTPPPPSPPPPPPPPRYLTQFEGQPWFERHKAYIHQRLKDPPNVQNFFNVVCDVMGISIDWEHRTHIVDALLLLWQQEGMTVIRYVLAALASILNAQVPPDAKDPTQVQFLRSALKLHQRVSGDSKEFIVELLTEYLEGDTSHKSYVRRILQEQGLQDAHQFLVKELDSWEVWSLDNTRALKPQLKEMVERWFSEWNERFKNHIETTMDRLKKGDIRAKMRRPGMSKTAEGGKRVQFAVTADEAVSKTVTAMEVLNYFCEIMLEDELERNRLANQKPEPTKNTVLVLPKIEGKQAIVRLGEMHTARRVRERQELAVEYRLDPFVRPYPDLMAAFTSKLNLPVSRVYMNPFPSEIDRFDEWTDAYQPILLTLRSPAHQKYFVPERSYVHLV